MATPLPLLLLTATETHPFRRDTRFQSLLDAGTVLGYEVYIKRHIDGAATGSALRIALPDGDNGVVWLDSTDAVLRAEAHTPGLVLAGFALAMDLWCTVPPRALLGAWAPHDPDSDERVSYARVFVARNGYVVGVDDPLSALDWKLAELFDTLEACETDAERDEEVEDWDIGQIAAIALLSSPAPSAHERLTLTKTAQCVFADWSRAYPEWRAKGLDLCAPTV